MLRLNAVLIPNELNHCYVQEFAPAFAGRTPPVAIYNTSSYFGII